MKNTFASRRGGRLLRNTALQETLRISCLLLPLSSPSPVRLAVRPQKEVAT